MRGVLKPLPAGHAMLAPLASAAVESAPAEIDEAAFHRLYQHAAPRLHRYAVRVMGSTADADDVVQDAFIRLLQSGSAVCDESSAWPRLLRIASNLMIDQWRRRQRWRTTAVDLQAPASEVDHAMRLDLLRTFARLTCRERQLLWLAYVEGASHREIGAALDLQTFSVRVLLLRARRKLRRLLGSRASEVRL